MNDVVTALQELQRRRALLDQTGQQIADTKIVGPRGLAQALTTVARSALLAKQNADYDQQMGAAQGQYGEQLKNEANAYLDTYQGKPAVAGQDGAPGTPAVAGNPRAAVVAAMSSRLPEMQAIDRKSVV